MQNTDFLQISREVSGCSYVICSTLIVETIRELLEIKSGHVTV